MSELREKCGIVGIYGAGLPVSRLAFFALFSLPAVVLAIIAWILSIYTPYFKSLGQILLVIVFLVPLFLLELI